MKTAIVTDGKYRSSIAAVRALGRAGWRVVAVQAREDVQAPPPVFASVYTAETRWIEGSCQDPGYGEKLLDLCQSMGDGQQRPVLFCVGAASLNAVAAQREAFAQKADFLVAGPQVLDSLNDKEQVQRRAEELGLPVPKQYFGPPEAYPVVVKPHCGEKFGLKAADRYKIARNPEEYQAALQALAPYDPSPIVQERVEGDGCGASLLLDREGRLVCALCHRRVREYPIAGGPSACCVSEYDQDRVERAHRLLRSFGFVGAAMVEFKGDRLLEVNPRIWGSFPLTERAESPFAALYARAAAGERLDYQPEDYRAGVKMRFLLNDTLATLSLLKAGRLGPALRGIGDMVTAQEALKAKDDPLPQRAYIRQALKRGK